MSNLFICICCKEEHSLDYPHNCSNPLPPYIPRVVETPVPEPFLEQLRNHAMQTGNWNEYHNARWLQTEEEQERLWRLLFLPLPTGLSIETPTKNIRATCLYWINRLKHQLIHHFRL